MSDNRLPLVNWPIIFIGLALVAGFVGWGELKKRRMRLEGVDQARPACVEQLGAQTCEEHVRLHAPECFRLNYVSSGGRYQPRVETLRQKPFEECLVMTPVIWLEGQRQARREAAKREAAQQREIESW